MFILVPGCLTAVSIMLPAIHRARERAEMEAIQTQQLEPTEEVIQPPESQLTPPVVSEQSIEEGPGRLSEPAATPSSGTTNETVPAHDSTRRDPSPSVTDAPGAEETP